MPIGIGIGVAGALGAAGSLAGSIIGSGAARDAAGIQAGAADRASAVEQRQYNITRGDLAPYRAAGGNALAALSQLLGLPDSSGAGSAPNNLAPDGTAGDPRLVQVGPGTWQNTVTGATFDDNGYAAQAASIASNRPGPAPSGVSSTNVMNSPLLKPFDLSTFQQSPGYQFQKDQGISAIMNNASALGGPLNGNTLREINTFGTGVANQDWYSSMNAYNQNQNNIFNRLNTVAGQGQNAAAQTGAFGSAAAGQVGSNIIGGGNALAAGQIGSANAISGGINGISQNFLLAAMMRGGNPGGGLPPGAVDLGNSMPWLTQ